MPQRPPSVRLSRRGFVSATAAWLVACNSSEPLQAFQAQQTQPATAPAPGPLADYGPLAPVADETTGLPLLKLPDGFSYLSMGWHKDPMTDGRPTPARHDGMGVVGADGDVLTLIRNHEVVAETGALIEGPASYDAKAGGGTTTLQFNTRSKTLEASWVSLSGTVHNCAGGVTPWGTWLSCEELVCGPGEMRMPFLRGDLEQEHGYVFEVGASRLDAAVPLKDMGRFRHEAAAIDPATGIVYLTEDHSVTRMAGFYRFIPRTPGKLVQGGSLQILCVANARDLRTGVVPDQWVDVSWQSIEEPDRGHAPGTNNMHGVLAQGVDVGGAVFSRLEGCWFTHEGVYFVSTDGGDASRGQVFLYEPANERLKLIYQSPGASELDMPDNLAQSPRGGLVLCEDGDRLGQLICGLSRTGQVFQFAQNNVILNGEIHGFAGDFRTREWAGVCFSPDGQWMFANAQTPGITFAITGPWRDGLI